MAFFDYDLTKLLTGRVNIYIAPHTADLPAGIADILGQESPYTVVSPWRLVGATSAATVVNRNITVAGQKIQQTNLTLLEEVTDVTRTIAIPACEMTTDQLAMFEQGGAVDTSVAGESHVPFGSILDLVAYRVAVIGRFKKSQRLVTETGGLERGAMLGYVAYNATVSADNAAVTFNDGDLVTIPVTVNCKADDAVSTEGEEVGYWVLEDAATLTGS